VLLIKKTNKEVTCCFTGPRPQRLPFGFHEEDSRCIKLKQVLREQIINMIETYRVAHFISGVALGVDQYAAEIVLELKKNYPQITLECVIHCETQAVRWTELLRDRYFSIIERCDKETLLQYQYTADSIQKRNEYMVRQSDYVLAVWDGKSGGTGRTVSFARLKGKPVISINPMTLEVRPNIQIIRSNT
jgi:uncharacterized phage-like protein YoqJ